MAPSVAPAPFADAAASSHVRTLLLAPPSISAHPEALNKIVEAHDRSRTDIQMLDRLALGLVSLPDATYDVVLLLTDADGTRTESQKILDRQNIAGIVRALRPGGLLKSQDGLFASSEGPEKTEAILAGLMARPGLGMYKPSYMGTQSIPLKLSKKSNAAGPPLPLSGTTTASNGLANGKRRLDEAPPAGVGFDDFSDDFYMAPLEDGEEDELIDEDTLLTEQDKARPIMPPPECQPKVGKRRRACKDCTCGLKQQIEAEDNAKRASADNALNTMKLEADDLTEVDFTVQGKVGSCGNCALGDAFRCDGCPYIGLPAFKPGEEVRLLNNDIQL